MEELNMRVCMLVYYEICTCDCWFLRLENLRRSMSLLVISKVMTRICLSRDHIGLGMAVRVGMKVRYMSASTDYAAND